MKFLIEINRNLHISTKIVAVRVKKSLEPVFILNNKREKLMKSFNLLKNFLKYYVKKILKYNKKNFQKTDKLWYAVMNGQIFRIQASARTEEGKYECSCNVKKG